MFESSFCGHSAVAIVLVCFSAFRFGSPLYFSTGGLLKLFLLPRRSRCARPQWSCLVAVLVRPRLVSRHSRILRLRGFLRIQRSCFRGKAGVERGEDFNAKSQSRKVAKRILLMLVRAGFSPHYRHFLQSRHRKDSTGNRQCPMSARGLNFLGFCMRFPGEPGS